VLVDPTATAPKPTALELIFSNAVADELPPDDEPEPPEDPPDEPPEEPPDEEAVIPVPVTLTCVDPFAALLATWIMPFALPAAFGVKVTLKKTVFPTPRLMGSEGPLVTNAEFVEVRDDNVTAAVPVFVTVKEVSLMLPTLRLPKLIVPGFAAVELVLLGVRPATFVFPTHPETKTENKTLDSKPSLAFIATPKVDCGQSSG
jgi:hypothetical protein